MTHPYYPGAERQIDVRRSTAPTAEYDNVRDHFEREMRRVEQEMSRLRSDFETYSSRASAAGGDSPKGVATIIRPSPRPTDGARVARKGEGEGGTRNADRERDYHYQQQQHEQDRPIRHSPSRSAQKHHEDNFTNSRGGGQAGRTGNGEYRTLQRPQQSHTATVTQFPAYPFYDIQSLSAKKPAQRGGGTSHYITTTTTGVTKTDGGTRGAPRPGAGGGMNGSVIRVSDPDPYYPPATPAVYPNNVGSTVPRQSQTYKPSATVVNEQQRSFQHQTPEPQPQRRGSPRQQQQIVVRDPEHSRRSAPYDAYQFGKTPVTSPLIRDDSDSRYLRLRFDVGQYNPDEISVKTIDNRLLVYAKHEEKSSGKAVFREYNQEFMLPRGTDPAMIKSTLSIDGVLTVEAPLAHPEVAAIDQFPSNRSSRGREGGSLRYSPQGQNQRAIRYK